MRYISTFGGVRGRLAVLILLAMTALVGLLVMRAVDKRNDDRRDNEANLLRLATFAAQAERERFDAAQRLLALSAQAGTTLRDAALDPGNTELFDRCTRSLFVLDQLLPETSGFSLWDTSGRVICSSEAAATGEYSVADKLWFQTARERNSFATGDFELSPPDDAPSIGFGIPILDATGSTTVAYLSTGLRLDRTDELLAGANLPETARIGVVDHNGVILGSSSGRTGELIADFNTRFGGLAGYLDGRIADGADGRRVASVRVTDAGDAAVSVSIGADKSALAAPLIDTLPRELFPVAIVALLTLLAVWLLGERWVARPVASLVDASEAIARGELDARAKASHGVAEFDRLAAAFNEMAATREQATHAKDEFIGLVSHELKTPMTTALGNAAVLRARYDQLAPESRQLALDDIHDSLLRLAAIIDNMLVLARLDRGLGLEAEPIALLRVTQAAAMDEARRAGGRRVIVTGDGGILALGGESYVDQVVRNLVANALKYSPTDSDVEVVVDQADGTALVTVLDRGEGVPDDEREAIFQPFYRSRSTAAMAEGVGIGLSVCKRLIESMGGTVSCASRPGGGGSFSFSLPLLQEEPIALTETEQVTDLPERSVAVGT